MSSAFVQGVDFCGLLEAGASEEEVLVAVCDAMISTGLQATMAGRGIELLTEMLQRKRSDPDHTKVYLSYTSNMISCGLREIFAFLAKEKLVDAFISTAGGIEEDVIKCLGPTIIGDFALSGAELRGKGMNRIGNLLVPNDNYVAFEDFFDPVLKKIHDEQRRRKWDGVLTSPSEIIHFIGEELAKWEKATEGIENSVVYWCATNGIPMFCPALTDGSMGDMIFFHNFNTPGIVVDPLADERRLGEMVQEQQGELAGCIVLGGGLPKCTLLRHVGRCVCSPPPSLLFICTGSEVEGCESGCNRRDDESRGEIPAGAKVVKVQGDATLSFPVMITRALQLANSTSTLAQ